MGHTTVWLKCDFFFFYIGLIFLGDWGRGVFPCHAAAPPVRPPPPPFFLFCTPTRHACLLLESTQKHPVQCVCTFATSEHAGAPSIWARNAAAPVLFFFGGREGGREAGGRREGNSLLFLAGERVLANPRITGAVVEIRNFVPSCAFGTETRSERLFAGFFSPEANDPEEKKTTRKNRQLQSPQTYDTRKLKSL